MAIKGHQPSLDEAGEAWAARILVEGPPTIWDVFVAAALAGGKTTEDAMRMADEIIQARAKRRRKESNNAD